MARKKVIEIVLDTETTGLDYTREKMVEFAGVKLVNGKITDKFETLINPEQHIRKSSIAVHGITPDMVEDAPKEPEAIKMILDFIEDYPIVAHNAIFDYSFINEASKRVFGKEIKNQRIDTQMMFKEVYPEIESCGLDSVMAKFNVTVEGRHRAMADAMGLALSYPSLKKLYEKKYDWQFKQIGNVEYLFERYLRIQQAISTMQAEIQDLKSICRIYFENGGEDVHSPSGEILTYQSKQGFGYDFMQIKDILNDIGALEKAVKVNNNFIDRLVSGFSLNEDLKTAIKEARQEYSETKNIQVIKKGH